MAVAVGWGRVAEDILQAPVEEVHMVAADRGYCAVCVNRRIGEYSGYTYNHLPNRNKDPELFRKDDATFAIFAARMARSSLEIRSLLR